MACAGATLAGVAVLSNKADRCRSAGGANPLWALLFTVADPLAVRAHQQIVRYELNVALQWRAALAERLCAMLRLPALRGR